MKKFFLLAFFALLLSVSSFAVGSIYGTTHVCVGSTTTLGDSTTGGSWYSDNTAVATINTTTGVVTGVSAGTALITYYLSGSLTTVSFTVNPPPAAIAGTTTVAAGGTTTLTDATGGGVWSTGSSSIATITSAGVVTGVSAGTVGVYYSMTTGCTVYAVMTVTGSSTSGTSSITGASHVCVGSTTTLSDSTSGGTWSSSNTSIATVSSIGVVTGVSAGTVTISYYHSGSYATMSFTVNPPPSAIAGTTTVAVGGTTTLTDATGGGVWSIGSSSIATITSAGVVTGVSAGTCGVYYLLTTGCLAYTSVTVTGSSTSGTSSITGASHVCVGSTTTLSDSTTGGTWSSSNTAIATVSSIGVVTGVSAGTVTISYYHSGSYATMSFTVNPPPAAIVGTTTVAVGGTTVLADAVSDGTWSSGNTSIAIVNATSGVVTGVSAGTVGIYYVVGGCGVYTVVTVTGSSTSGTSSITGASHVCVGSTTTLSDSTTGGTWSSSNTAIATVSSIGVVTGVSAGTVTISYYHSGSYATMSFTVNPPPAAIVGTTTVAVGGTTILADAVSGGTWSSGNTSIATVNATSGVVTGVSAGTVGIYYVVGGCGVYTVVTVTGSSTSGTSHITGASHVCVGSTTTLSDSTTGGTWSSSNTAIATVSSIGLVTGVSAGTVTISYYHSGSYATMSFTVNPPPAAISGTTTVTVGGTTTLTDATGGGVWSIGSSSIATITSAGVVTGVSAGTCGVYYLLTTGCLAYTSVTVTGSSTSGTSSITGASHVCVGSTTTLSDSTTGGTWSSSNTAIATVSSIGVVTGVSAGTVTISYYHSGSYATMSFTVNPPPAAIVGTTTVAVGGTTILADAVSGGTWSSGNTSIATVNATSGVVTGVSAGTVGIYYVVGGCGVYTVVTVTGSSTSGTSHITGASHVCVGSTTTLSDSTTGGTWSSSNTAIATVSSIGLVTGVSAGTVTISYYHSGSYATMSFTVNPPPAAISGTTTVTVGGTTTLTDATGGGVWSIGSSSIATITSAGVVTGVSAGTCGVYYLLTTGCLAYTSVTVTGPSTSGTSSITGASHVCVGSTTTLSDSTTGGTWSSSNTAIATVSSIGVVTGVSAGTVTISYYHSGSYATMSFTVNPPPAAIVGTTTVAVGGTTILADAVSGGTWSSGNTSIATVNATSGVVTGVSAGTVGIYYVVGGCGVYTVVTVTGSSTSGTSHITGTSHVCVGSTATLSDSTSGGTWSSSNTAIATVSSIGVVTGVSAGTVTISYYHSGSYATMSFTVNPIPSAISGTTTVAAGSTTTLTDAVSGGAWSSGNTSIAIVNATTGVVTGVAAGTVGIYYVLPTGCGVYTGITVTGSSTLAAITGTTNVCVGSATTLSDATTGGYWSSSNTSIATVSSTGVVTGVSAGTATISYYHSGSTVTVSFTIHTPPSAISGSSSVCVGSTTTLADAATGGTWTSGNTSVATVTSTGVVLGVGAGIVNIYYSVGDCYVYKTITVNPMPAAIYGSSAICSGSSITLSDAVTGGSWISSNTSVATVSTAGVVTSLGTGVVNIYYLVGGCAAYKTVTVNAAPAPLGGSSSVCTGSTITLTESTSGGTLSSSNTAIATITSLGVVTGVSAGVVNIYYSIGGCSVYKTVTVNPAPAAISGSSTVDVGSTIILTDAVGGGTWVSSGGSIATISSAGVVTGLAAGIINIYYLEGSCGVYKTVTVDPLAPGPAHIGGSVSSGGGRGTSGEIPVVGMTINLQDPVSNIVLTSTATDASGNYSFGSLPLGNYIVYPEASGYTVTPSPIIALSASAENVTGINFRELIASNTIAPTTTEVNQVIQSESLIIFPNPTTGVLNIQWQNQSTGAANVVITDIAGREVYKSVIDINNASGQTQIRLSSLMNGIYLITIKSDNIYYSNKLVIQQ